MRFLHKSSLALPLVGALYALIAAVEAQTCPQPPTNFQSRPIEGMYHAPPLTYIPTRILRATGSVGYTCSSTRWVRGPSRFVLTSIYASTRWGDITEDGATSTSRSATLTVTGHLSDEASGTVTLPLPTPVRYRFTREGSVTSAAPDVDLEWAMFLLPGTSTRSPVYLYRVNTVGGLLPRNLVCATGEQRSERATAEYWAFEKPTTVNTLWVKDNPRLCQAVS